MFIEAANNSALNRLCANVKLAYNPRVAKMIEVHPTDPQPHRVAKIVERIRDGALIAYPTDSSYAFGCRIGDKKAIGRIHRIRRTDKKHNFTLVCADISEISVYARVDNWAYRLIKSLTPGPYTFILPATRQLPKMLQNPKRRTIGIRVPDHSLVTAMLEQLGEPIMSSTLSLPGDDMPLTDPVAIEERIGHQIEVVVDAGATGIDPTTILDLSGGHLEILRIGRGDVSQFT
jgi:tRNA threonylcarbamoyl adenosine modification protein (Sua5/YciO/YrdC/YwlC family)